MLASREEVPPQCLWQVICGWLQRLGTQVRQSGVWPDPSALRKHPILLLSIGLLGIQTRRRGTECSLVEQGLGNVHVSMEQEVGKKHDGCFSFFNTRAISPFCGSATRYLPLMSCYELSVSFDIYYLFIIFFSDRVLFSCPG